MAYRSVALNPKFSFCNDMLGRNELAVILKRSYPTITEAFKALIKDGVPIYVKTEERKIQNLTP